MAGQPREGYIENAQNNRSDNGYNNDGKSRYFGFRPHWPGNFVKFLNNLLNIMPWPFIYEAAKQRRNQRNARSAQGAQTKIRT